MLLTTSRFPFSIITALAKDGVQVSEPREGTSESPVTLAPETLSHLASEGIHTHVHTHTNIDIPNVSTLLFDSVPKEE